MKDLKKATVQEIQLELIRRRNFNSFFGTNIVKALKKNANLWDAVYTERDFIPLIKLRDLSRNSWNTDLLYILVGNPLKAEKLADILNKDLHADEVEILTNTSELLGWYSAQHSFLVIRAWWD